MRFLHTVERIMFVDGHDVRRTPMVAELFRHFAKRDPLLTLWETEFDSAGISTNDEDSHPVEKANAMLKKKGLDILTHQAKSITFEDIKNSSIILTMTAKHTSEVNSDVLKEYPSFHNKVLPLPNYLGLKEGELPDLWGAKQSVFDDFVEKIDKIMPLLKAKLRQDTRLPLLAKGQGMGSDTHVGKIKIVKTSEQAGDIEKGDVVVCHTNHVSSLLGEAVERKIVGAIITESGSEAMHLSPSTRFSLHIPSQSAILPVVGSRQVAEDVR